MSATYPFTIEMLERDGAGHWVAALDVYGESVAVDRSQGSWRYTPTASGRWQELPLRYAEALQERVRRLERAERKEVSAMDK